LLPALKCCLQELGVDLEAFAWIWLCLPSPCPQRRWDPIRQGVKLELLTVAGGIEEVLSIHSISASFSSVWGEAV